MGYSIYIHTLKMVNIYVFEKTNFSDDILERSHRLLGAVPRASLFNFRSEGEQVLTNLDGFGSEIMIHRLKQKTVHISPSFPFEYETFFILILARLIRMGHVVGIIVL